MFWYVVLFFVYFYDIYVFSDMLQLKRYYDIVDKDENGVGRGCEEILGESIGVDGSRYRAAERESVVSHRRFSPSRN